MIATAENLAIWSAGEWSNLPTSEIGGFNHDTRTIKDGDIFVAIRGDQFDGHNFVEKAFSLGAVAALVNSDFDLEGYPLLKVADTKTAILEMAKQYRRTWRGKVFGVTGSVGKTTTKEMVADVLSSIGKCERTRGNWNNDIGLPLCMLNADKSAENYVFELGMNHPGEIALLTETLEPDVGIMTTVGPVHLEHFESVEAIAREKASLFEGVKTYSVLASDEPYFDILKNSAKSPITVALSEDADYSVVKREDSAFWVFEKKSGETHRYFAPLPGEHIIKNAMRAIAIGRESGIDPVKIAEKLSAYKSLSMRWDISEHAGVTFVNDAYNANPISMKAAITAFFEMPCENQRWIVLGGMRELGETSADLHSEIGKFASEFAKERTIFVGDFAGDLSKFAPESNCFLDTKAAGEFLKANAASGDLILLKASRGESLEQVINFFDGE